MKSSQDASERWKRVCELSSRLLDSPKAEWDSILDRECDADGELRSQVLAICSNYSETDEFFGELTVPPLLFEDHLIREESASWNGSGIPDGEPLSGPTGRME